jgi:anti-sigma B factor antagonist
MQELQRSLTRIRSGDGRSLSVVFSLHPRSRRSAAAPEARPEADGPRFEVYCAGEESLAPREPARQTVLCVSGEVDLVTSPRLAAAVAGALGGRHRHVVVDLADVEFIDVTGIRVLLDAASQARKAGGDLLLRSPSRAARRALELLHLEAAMIVEP